MDTEFLTYRTPSQSLQSHKGQSVYAWLLDWPCCTWTQSRGASLEQGVQSSFCQHWSSWFQNWALPWVDAPHPHSLASCSQKDELCSTTQGTLIASCISIQPWARIWPRDGKKFACVSSKFTIGFHIHTRFHIGLFQLNELFFQHHVVERLVIFVGIGHRELFSLRVLAAQNCHAQKQGRWQSKTWQWAGHTLCLAQGESGRHPWAWALYVHFFENTRFNLVLKILL